MKDVALFDFNGESTIGLYCKRVGDVLICGLRLTDAVRERIERILKVRIIHVTVAGTPYPGIFLLPGEGRIIAPHIMYESEREALLAEGFAIEMWNTFDTALANAVAIDGTRAIISSAAHASLREALVAAEFDVLELETGAYEAPGSLIVPAQDSVLVGAELDSEAIAQFFAKPTVGASVNRGSPFLASGLVWSENGVLIGKESLPGEVMTITEVL
jgi:translation initiation factor 6 (eIF-6)